ncbi:FecR domain-containing protein [Microbulbifer bruguierae]|uniref:FecR domain-containing protein n=1 Tax=Microbulbifer bruguierae TaxID=3029061 RepID=A0ABY8NBR1_9GAMM|nr:FecR domain-containing protein [Microbulbifer bruguierae]WGL16361.1 FecR domain-containing protein [Microbulbifer bruguierae]
MIPQEVQKVLAEDRLDQACTWIARLRSDALSDADRRAFTAWMSESAANRQAFDEMAELWGDLGVLSRFPLDELYPESVPTRKRGVSPDNAPSRPSPRHSSRPTPSAPSDSETSRWYLPQWLLGGSAVAACFGIALWVGNQWFEQAPLQQQMYTTAIGETRTVSLPDGSVVQLNTNSELIINFSREQRRTQLLRGEAYFDVARQTSRPFTVAAGTANIRVLGTQFNIERNPDNTRISVTEGVVAVSETHSASGLQPEAVKLTRNQKVSVSGSGLSDVARTSPEEALDWTRGQLVFDETPLNEALEELNRYLKVPAAAASDVREQTLSGTFELTDPENTLSAIAAALGLTQDNSDPNLTLLSPASN